MLVLDPLSAFLSGEINTHRDADVRRVLTQLKSLAERMRAAVIVVRHLVKAPQGAAITAGGGSIGFIGGARTAHLAATDPDDPERFVLAVVKNNLAKKEPSIRYRIETSADGSPHPVFDEFTTHRADELVAAARERDDPNRLAIDDAVDFLREALSDTAGVPKKDLLLRAKEQGITESTLGRAGTKLGVEQRRTGWPATTRWFYCQSPKSPQVDVTGAPSPPKLLSDNAPTVTSPGLTRLAPTSAMARLQNGDKNAVEEGEI